MVDRAISIRRLSAALPVLLAAGAVLAGHGAGVDAVAYLLPALLLLAPLALRRYPGERALLTAIARRSGGQRCVRAARSHTARRPSGRVLPRGGLLIATSLAVRPPPRGGLV